MDPKTKWVKVPSAFEPLFLKAEENISEYFKGFKQDPTKGEITIGEQRYVLARASAISLEFQKELSKKYGEMSATQIIYSLGKSIGKQDAETFAKKMNLTDPIEKLSAGPVHFAWMGWAFVDIFPESNPQPNENYYLIYEHPYSFEAQSYIEAGIKTKNTVCLMNAGYSSGWCQFSFGVDLDGKEISCRAKGDEKCIFVMGHPTKLTRYVVEAKKKYNIP